MWRISSMITTIEPSAQKRTLPTRISRKCARSRPLVCRASSIDRLQQVKIQKEIGFNQFPQEPAIYAIYNTEEELQYVGITRKLRMSVMGHSRDLPELAKSVRYEIKSGATKEELAESWKSLIENYVKETGQAPPGNVSGNTQWHGKKRDAKLKAEIKLTPGKGIEDLMVPIEEIIDHVVKSNKIVAFIKGTRIEPKCGFSYQVLTLLNRHQVDYEIVNVLDEVHNPGLREVMKSYSQWPTIPQVNKIYAVCENLTLLMVLKVYVNGEFVGGADILTELQEQGKLAEMVKKE